MSGVQRQPYVRPVEPRWWARPPYLAYTVREASGALIALYGLILLWGVIALWRGAAAYDAWLGFIGSAAGVALHVAVLAAMVWHAWTWFQIMPKTMPRIVIGGAVLPQRRITLAGLWVALISNVAVLALAAWVYS